MPTVLDILALREPAVQPYDRVSKWRYTFRRLAAGALAALTASDPAPAQQAVAKIVDLACDMKAYLDFAVEVGAELPSRARELAAERARAAEYAGTT